MITERLPFEEAISDHKLLKNHFDLLSLQQQVALKAFYGLALSAVELDVWSMFQGGSTFDPIGFVKSTRPVPYSPKEYDTLIAILGRRSGKALALDTPIPTPNGWTTMGELSVDDEVFSDTGEPCRVTFATGVQRDRECYRLTFSDGHTIIADKDHQWFAWDKAARKTLSEPQRSARPRVVTTEEISDSSSSTVESNWAIELAGPVEYPHAYLPLDPYLFGVWLGDGTSSAAAITTADPEIVEAWREQWNTVRPNPNYPITYSVPGGLRTILRELGVLGNKYVPPVYKFSSVEQRIALVQGLLDSDGYSTHKGCEFYSTNLNLAQSVQELVESLGCRATFRSKTARLYGKDCGLVYTVEFQAWFSAFRLPRKVAIQTVLDPAEKRFRYIQRIEQIPSVHVKCIQVDSPSHLFLASKGFIPTHNTSSIASTIVAYEAVLGGHAAHVAKGQDYQIFFVAQDISAATSHLKFVSGILRSSPLLEKAIDKEISDTIRLKNGMTITPQPPTIKAARGMAIPVVVMDEAAFWYTDAKAANPDFEVEIAIEYAQNQFPFAKKVVPSTPWTKEGLLWKYHNAGTEGSKIKCDSCKRGGIWRCPHTKDEQREHEGVLVLEAPSAAMGLKFNTRKVLAKKQAKRPDAFRRESLAEFVDSISGFLPASLIGDAVDQKITSRPRLPRADHPEDITPVYIAALDPAFRGDAFAFTLLHHDPKMGMVQDRFMRWVPSPGAPLNPVDVLDQITLVLNEFGLKHTYSDQYQLESLQQLAMQRGWSIIGCDFTGQSKAKIFGSLEMLVKQRRLRLLDDATLYQELVQLEKKRTANGTIQICAPPGKHDDGPAVLAMACYQAVYLLPTQRQIKPIVTTIHDQCMAQIQSRQEAQRREQEWGD